MRFTENIKDDKELFLIQLITIHHEITQYKSNTCTSNTERKPNTDENKSTSQLRIQVWEDYSYDSFQHASVNKEKQKKKGRNSVLLTDANLGSNPQSLGSDTKKHHYSNLLQQ